MRTHLASEIGLDAKDGLDGIATSDIVGVVDVAEEGLAAVLVVDLERAARVEGGKLGLHEGDDLLLNLLGGHVGHEADAELANDLARHHRLAAAAVERTLHTVDGQGREAPAVHEDVLLLAVDELAHSAGLLAEGLGVEVDGAVQLLLLLGQRTHIVANARNENVAVRVDNLGEQTSQVNHGLVDDTAKDTRVQVLGRSLDLHHKVHNAAQTVRDARLLLSQPVCRASCKTQPIGDFKQLSEMQK